MARRVDLVHLVGLVLPNKRDKPNNDLLTLAAFFSILLAQWREHRDDTEGATGTACNFHRQGDHAESPVRKIA